MSDAIFQTVLARSNSCCELCSSTNDLSLYVVLPHSGPQTVDNSIALCQVCKSQIENPSSIDSNHWRCLNETIWNEHNPVKVMSWRMLKQLKNESWSSDLLEQLYLDEETLARAQAGLVEDETEVDSSLPTLDSNGTRLLEGDSVTLIKDLEVKGGGFTAKRGTLVKNITLTNNPKHIEGKVNGIQIVLVAAYLKKA
jgi:protein PhnA